MIEDLKADLTKRMTIAYDLFAKELGGLRTGRASPVFLEGVMVEAYGTPTPIAQVGSINVADARMLTVQVWDQSLVKTIEKAIRDSNLGVNPSSEGSVIRVLLPDLTQERRLELIKVANKYAENARISVRAVRRDGMDSAKKMEKDKAISEDEARRLGDEVQEVTNIFIKKIDDLFSAKEKDLSQI